MQLHLYVFILIHWILLDLELRATKCNSNDDFQMFFMDFCAWCLFLVENENKWSEISNSMQTYVCMSLCTSHKFYEHE